jgi:hypothetical protein
VVWCAAVLLCVSHHDAYFRPALATRASHR